MLTNDLLPGDISMEDFALAFAGKGGWLQCIKQLWQCRYHSLLWSMYTCSFIVHMSSFNIALPVMHCQTSFFFGFLLWADSRDFCLISFFVLAVMPKVPMCKNQNIIENLDKTITNWMIGMIMLAFYPLHFVPKLLCRFAFSSTTWRGPTLSSKYTTEPCCQ